MIETKLIEIRDAGTFIPAMLIRVEPDGSDDSYLLRRAGWRNNAGTYLMHMQTCECEYDPYEWKGSRTMHVAHNYLKRCDFDGLKHGELVDVEFILGEADEPKESERMWTPS